MKSKAKYYLVPVAVCLLGVAALAFYCVCTTFSKQESTHYLYIDDDDNVDSVMSKLDTVGCSHSLAGLSMLMRHTEYANHIRTGRYAIEPGMNTYEVLRRLRNGQQEPIMLTIPEVRTVEQLAGRLARKLMIDSATITDRLLGAEFDKQDSLHAPDPAWPCLFVPDTYEVYWNISIDGLLERMERERDRFWERYGRQQLAASIDLTPEEVCTLASIIDEETANNAEKPMIAGMYLNRLRIGMPLQADPTVKFAVGDFSLRRILNKHLEVESPYNTYLHAGLPPGPIKIASQKGIDAVLHAVSHDYLYMCAKEDFSGTHNFAVTYQEHQRNAARYVRALNARGIK